MCALMCVHGVAWRGVMCAHRPAHHALAERLAINACVHGVAWYSMVGQGTHARMPGPQDGGSRQAPPARQQMAHTWHACSPPSTRADGKAAPTGATAAPPGAYSRCTVYRGTQRNEQAPHSFGAKPWYQGHRCLLAQQQLSGWAHSHMQP